MAKMSYLFLLFSFFFISDLKIGSSTYLSQCRVLLASNNTNIQGCHLSVFFQNFSTIKMPYFRIAEVCVKWSNPIIGETNRNFHSYVTFLFWTTWVSGTDSCRIVTCVTRVIWTFYFNENVNDQSYYVHSWCEKGRKNFLHAGET